jgi:SAM-dependent methyltransferase
LSGFGVGRAIGPERLRRLQLLSLGYESADRWALAGWAEDLDFFSDLAKGRRAILDLGCGTGVLAAALARKPDCLVVGVDPTAAMIALAKQRCGGASVSWLLDDARTASLNRRFDLVLLTSHAFQVFLTPDD